MAYVEVIVVPTRREVDGLAMSSRNVYLNPEERKVAPVLYRALTTAKDCFLQRNQRTVTVSSLLSTATAVINEVPEVKLDYLNVVDMNTGMDLQPTDQLPSAPSFNRDQQIMLSAAIFLGRTRLIDNIILNERDEGSKI